MLFRFRAVRGGAVVADVCAGAGKAGKALFTRR